jgi:hypothetical protein
MVRPVDVADNVAKTQVAEKITQVDKAAPEMDQRHFAAQLTKQLAEKHQKATATTKTDEVIIHREKQNKDEGKKKDKKKDKDKKKSSQLDVKA